jgi:AcrR family transcriptional regulator
MGDVHIYLPQEMRQIILREQALPWEEVEAMFREGVTPDGQPPLDTDMAAGLYAGVIWGQIWLRKVGRVIEPLSEELAARLVDVLLAGLSTSPAARAVESGPVLR